jgi:FemAB-related protein (PEP-CTERM system-associated)
LKVELLGPDREAQWDSFVEGCEAATFFHRAGWKQVLEEAFGHKAYYLLAVDAETVVGALPLIHMRSLFFGNSLVSLPFGVYGGVVADDPQVQAHLIGEAEALGRELNVDYIELRCLGGPQADWPSKDLYVTFRRALDPGEEENLKAVPRKQRAMIRKGKAKGLRSIVETDLERFYGMYSESVRNLGTPVFSRKYFRLLGKIFEKDCRTLTILSGDKPVASVMSFYFRDQVLPFYGGGTTRARELHGNDFMYWELMRRSCQEGVRLFDFGRSKVNSGSYRFKKHWGFEPEPLHYQYHLVRAQIVPNLSPNNPNYQMMIRAWQRLPLPIANVLGPFLSRSLG